jgi:hypothetical protein
LWFTPANGKGGLVFRRAPVLAFLILVLPAGRAVAADLKITDSRGTEVVLTGASIDYSGFMSSDTETQGIRVLQGDGRVMVKWTDIDSLKVVRRDDSEKPPRIELEILLRNGKKVAATLFRQGQMKLLGKTDLGDYSIVLDKVRTIVPVR